MCASSIYFASVYDFLIGFRNCSGSVVFSFILLLNSNKAIDTGCLASMYIRTFRYGLSELASMYVRTFRQILVWHRCTSELSDKYLSGIDARQNFPTNTCRMLASMYVRTFRQIFVVWSIPIAINKLLYSISCLSIKT